LQQELEQKDKEIASIRKELHETREASAQRERNIAGSRERMSAQIKELGEKLDGATMERAQAMIRLQQAESEASDGQHHIEAL